MTAACLSALVAILGLAVSAHAETWCVPHGAIGGSCPNVSPTIQGAVDAATAGSLIKVGVGVAPERVTMHQRVKLQCLPGALLTDAGLEPAGPILDYVGTYSALVIDDCPIEVHSSDPAIRVAHSVSWFRLNQSSLTRIGERAGTGILVDGSGGPNHAKRAWITHSTIGNFDIGADYIDAAWMNPEPVTFTGNRIGLRCRNCQGQIFWSFFRRNEIALHIASLPAGVAQVGQLDINANTFGDPDDPTQANGVAVQWDTCPGVNTEFNHGKSHDSVVPFRVQLSAGSYVEGPDVYHQAVGSANQFADWTVCEGGACTTYDTAAFTTTGGVCP